MARTQKTELQANLFPTEIYTDKGLSEAFSMIHQGPATNQLSRVSVKKNEPLKVDPFKGRTLVTSEGLTASFSSSLLAHNMRPSTQMLLDTLTARMTETGSKGPVVTMSLTEYMALRGLKDRKSAREQVKKDLAVIFDAQISFEAGKGKGAAFLDMRICEAKGIDAKGQISVSFAPTYFSLVTGYPVMPYAKELLKINSNNSPFAYGLGRKILELKNMNAGKPSEDIISVKTLLKAAPGLPTYKEVMATDRHLTKRIIQPFIDNLDACDALFTWEFCHSKKRPLTDQELEALDYSLFERLYVRIFWRTYPDQTQRLEAKKAVKPRKPRASKEKGPAGGKAGG